MGRSVSARSIQFADIGDAFFKRRTRHIPEIRTVGHLLFEKNYRAVLAQQQKIIIAAQEKGLAKIAVSQIRGEFTAFIHIVLKYEGCADSFIIGRPFVVKIGGGIPVPLVDAVGWISRPCNVALV